MNERQSNEHVTDFVEIAHLLARFKQTHCKGPWVRLHSGFGGHSARRKSVFTPLATFLARGFDLALWNKPGNFRCRLGTEQRRFVSPSSASAIAHRHSFKVLNFIKTRKGQ